MTTGKAIRIISRFPDFYSSESPDALLPQLIDLFGQILDATEGDLIRVLRSHYVDTADNFGSQGLTSREKGDLDRIFSLYLETLGGTSRLTQVNQTFQTTDIRQISVFVEELVAAKSSLTQDIWQHLPASTQDQLHRYTPAQARFAADFSRPLIIRLIAAQDALTCYLHSQFAPTTRQALDSYEGTEPIPFTLAQGLAEDLNRLLRNPTLKHKFAERQIQIHLAIAIQKLLPLNPNEGIEQPSRSQSTSQYLRKRLSLVAQRLLSPLPRVPLEPEKIKATLAEELPLLFKQSSFCQQLLNAVTAPNLRSPIDESLPLSLDAIALLLQAAYTALEAILLGPVIGTRVTAPLEPSSLTPEVQRLLAQESIGDDLARLNRLLLEAAYPDLPASQIPAMLEVQTSLTKALNEQILPDANFDQRNQTSFSELSLPLEVQRLRSTVQTASDSEKQQIFLKRLNRLLLESAYPNYLEKSYAPYRERLRHLIAVLKNGASTKEGIIDIAAANLGIRTNGLEGMVKPWEIALFDLPISSESALQSLTVSPTLRQAFLRRGIGISYGATVAMEEVQRRWVITDINSTQVYVVYRKPDCLSVYRSLIRVIEFLPEPKTLDYQIHPQPTSRNSSASLELPTEFSVSNPNVLGITPAVQIRVRDHRSNRQGVLSPLMGLTLTNTKTEKAIQYLGSLNCDDVILFLPDGMVLINGVTVADPQTVIQGSLPELPSGNSTWAITARTGSALATFETTLFDFCRFDAQEIELLDDARSSSYRLEVRVMFDKLTPGSFMVKIPWDMPGYTDQFNETEDHPRHQISHLIEKVKAAGVQSVVTYEKQFNEEQEMMDVLTVKRSPFQEVHTMIDRDLVIRSQQKPYGLGLDHEITDTLVTSAVFDYSYFDSLNTLG